MDNLPVNITDIAVIIIVLVSAFLAYARGFVHEVLSVAGWIGAGFITIYGFPYAQPYARDLISIELAADLAAGVAIFIVSLAILSLLTRAISKLVQDSSLNALDRSLGFLFGMIRGAILVCLAYIAIEWMMPVPEQPAWLRNARTMPLIETGAEMLRRLIPEEAAASANTAAEKTNEMIKNRKVIEGLIAPEPKSGDKQPLQGYGEKVRTEMERLIDSSSQQ